MKRINLLTFITRRLLPLAAASAVCTLSSCFTAPRSNARGGELTGEDGFRWTDPEPQGMVLVDGGGIMMGPSATDSLQGVTARTKGVSVDAFWMDRTEITNSQYKQFVFWVRDSIIRERLADPAYAGDGSFVIDEDREGNPAPHRVNWDKAIPWRNPDEDQQRAIESVYVTNPLTGIRQLDPRQLNYRFETYNHVEAAKRANRLNPAERDYNTDRRVPAEIPVISKDTAYWTDSGEIVRRVISRPLTGPYDFLNTYIVNVFPDTTCWVNDFENAVNDKYSRMYFAHAGYNDYPVVGVSWEQANAFSAWRTDFLKRSLGKDGVYVEPYRLPTEAEWEYAARAGNSESPYPWEETLPYDERGCFYANFKPMEGDYVRDGHVITSPAGTFRPNGFGLYDMAGNVSEWTSTAYSETVDLDTPDLNPEYRYDAAPDDPYRLKRKIVRGGSWKDAAKGIRSDLRQWEYQNEQRSYIGFRNVRTHVGFSKGTKKKK